jgi:hypothetical protein
LRHVEFRAADDEESAFASELRKADPSVAFVDARKLLIAMTFARRGDLGMTATNELLEYE